MGSLRVVDVVVVVGLDLVMGDVVVLRERVLSWEDLGSCEERGGAVSLVAAIFCRDDLVVGFWWGLIVG